MSFCNSLIKIRLQGKVAFSSQGDRIAKTQVEQVVNGSYIILGYHNTENNTFNKDWRDAEWISKSVTI